MVLVKLTQNDCDSISRAFELQNKWGASLNSHTGHMRKLERYGLFQLGGMGHDIDGIWENEKPCWSLTTLGNQVASRLDKFECTKSLGFINPEAKQQEPQP